MHFEAESKAPIAPSIESRSASTRESGGGGEASPTTIGGEAISRTRPTHRPRVLEGAVAIVTGGSCGIGASIARALGESGAHVVISYSAHEDEAHAVTKDIEANEGVRALAIEVDHAVDDQSMALVERTIEAFGRVDILVCHVGSFVSCDVTKSSDLSGENLAQVSKMWRINTDSAVWCVRALADRISEGGRIVLIGSIAAECVNSKGMAEYAATKAALRGYCVGWCRDFAERRVTVNLIEPGYIETAVMTQQTELAKSFPAGRYGTPEEVAEAALWLASPASSFVNGAILRVDGGFMASHL